jgi:hypothetical protein
LRVTLAANWRKAASFASRMALSPRIAHVASGDTFCVPASAVWSDMQQAQPFSRLVARTTICRSVAVSEVASKMRV